MKWTVARRFMNPILRKKQYSRYQYGSILRNKQQLKSFYGQLKEKQLERLFKVTWLKKKQFKEEAFLGALEHRLDVLVFRMRILPTIFSCKQYILHQGVYVNNELITLPHYQVKIGDIISFKKEHWNLFYNRLKNKASIRLIGQEIINSDIKKKDREKHLILERYLKKYKRFNLKLAKELDTLIVNFKKTEKDIFLQIIQHKNLSKNIKLQILKFLIMLSQKLKRLIFSKHFFRFWYVEEYLINELFFILNIVIFQFYLNFLEKYIQEVNYFANKKNNYASKKNFFLYISKSYNDSLRNLEQYLLCSFRGHFLKPFTIEKNFFRKHRKRHLFERRKFNYQFWWLERNFKEERIKRYKWWWQSEPHWYTPSYLEIDYKTLRVGVLKNPTAKNIFYPFKSSVNQLISFYTDKGF
tara:strand:+ start:34890 stop:36125 length:1236 start_codon:yes stop_codon:yes gene_type:complete